MRRPWVSEGGAGAASGSSAVAVGKVGGGNSEEAGSVPWRNLPEGSGPETLGPVETDVGVGRFGRGVVFGDQKLTNEFCGADGTSL